MTTRGRAPGPVTPDKVKLHVENSSAPTGLGLGRGRPGYFLWVWALLSVGPIVWLFVNSLRPSADIFQAPFGFSSTLEWDNYRKAYQLSHFGQFLLNSLKVTAVTTVLTTFGGALLAYPIAVMQFRGRKLVNVLLAAGIAIPLQMLGLPIFLAKLSNSS